MEKRIIPWDEAMRQFAEMGAELLVALLFAAAAKPLAEAGHVWLVVAVGVALICHAVWVASGAVIELAGLAERRS